MATISAAGSISGLSAVGITSGLATIGFGQMIAGVAVVGSGVGAMDVGGVIGAVALRRHLAKRKRGDCVGEPDAVPGNNGVAGERPLVESPEPMSFKAVHLEHGQRAAWPRITHVKLRAGVRADTDQGQRVLDHIRVRANAEGVASISSIESDFPARKKNLDRISGMRVDLRHMANQRDAGENKLNKGLLELGWIE